MRSEHGKEEKLEFSLVFEEPTLNIWHIIFGSWKHCPVLLTKDKTWGDEKAPL